MLAIGLIIASSGCAVLMVLFNWLGLGKWRAARDQHWAERARLLFPARIAAQLNLLFLTGVCAITSLWVDEIRNCWYLVALAGFIGGLLGSYPFARAILPEFTFRTWLALTTIGWGARILVIAPLVLAILIAPLEWNGRMAFIAVGFALVHLWTSAGGLIHLWRWLRILRPVSESTRAVLEESFAQAAVRPRGVLMFTSPLLLAYAVPLRQVLIFSSGILEKCTPGELNAVCLHELAHLTEDRRTLLGRIVASFAVYPLIFVRPAISTFGLVGLLPIYCGFLFLVLFAKRVGRKAEVRADRIAAELEKDEGIYARALLKIYCRNQIPAVMRGKRQVHPHLYDRAVSAGVIPDFERPRPPAFTNWTVLVPMAVLLFLYIFLRFGSRS